MKAKALLIGIGVQDTQGPSQMGQMVTDAAIEIKLLHLRLFIGDISDLQYYLYKEDTARIAALGVNAHSFSSVNDSEVRVLAELKQLPSYLLESLGHGYIRLELQDLLSTKLDWIIIQIVRMS